ncbi:MAG: CYTH domain-containing protein [Spirulina sp. SIO3F2]|nr:CYTH domain-containing protein [Spirulina sp. SIO3F2]
MAIEIERKFLVIGEAWRTLASGIRYCQGYLCREPARTVRIRLAGEQGYLTIKGATQGITRAEFEYPIPVAEAEALLQLCDRPLIEKIRYRIPQGELVWEVDEFLGENQGLIVAEVELRSSEQTFVKPDWLGAEVSDDPRYFNAALVTNPYAQWQM